MLDPSVNSAAGARRDPNGERVGVAAAGDPDAALMLRARDGDDEAFSELYAKHRRALLAFTNRMIKDCARSEELVQEAFLRIYEARDRYQPSARFVSYMYRVMRNLCLNKLRQEGSVKLLRLDGRRHDDPGERSEIADDKARNPEAHVGDAELLSGIERAIERRPDKSMRALLMSRLEGYSYRQLAQRMDTSVSAVKSMVFRGTRALRDDLRQLLEQRDPSRGSGHARLPRRPIRSHLDSSERTAHGRVPVHRGRRRTWHNQKSQSS